MSHLDDHKLGVFRGLQTLEEFCDAQSAQRDHLELELQQFSLNVREAVMKACEDTLYNFLHKAGFNVKVRKQSNFNFMATFAQRTLFLLELEAVLTKIWRHLTFDHCSLT